MNDAARGQVRPLSREEVRGLDARALEELGLPGLLLMENAGRGAAEFLMELLRADGPPAAAERRAGPPRVLVLCGPGNNGGDGGVVARHLDGRGVDARVVWFAKRAELRGDAAFQWSVLERSGIDQSAWFDDRPEGADAGFDTEAEARALDSLMADADWLVDGLFGTGLTRPVTGRLHAVIAAINRSGKPVLALDVPSGLDADTGAVAGPIPDSRSQIQDSRSQVPDSGLQVQDSRSQIPDSRSQIPDSRLRIQDSRSQVPDSRLQTQDSSLQMQDFNTGAGPLTGIAVIARATATFAAPKVGFSAPGAERYTGVVRTIDIGLPRRLLAPFC